MKKERIILFLGIWIIILPFLGFPNTWDKVLFVITGLTISFVAYLFFRQKQRQKKYLDINNDVINHEKKDNFTDKEEKTK